MDKKTRREIKKDARKFGVPFLPGEWLIGGLIAKRSEKRLRAIAVWRRKRG